MRLAAYTLAATLMATPVLGQVVPNLPAPQEQRSTNYMLAYQEQTEAWQKNTFDLFALYGTLSGKIRDAFKRPDPDKIYPLIVHDPIAELDNPDMITLVDVVDRALDERKMRDARLAYEFPNDRQALENAMTEESTPLGDFGMLEDIIVAPIGRFIEIEDGVQVGHNAQTIYFRFRLGDKQYDGQVIRPLNERIPIRYDDDGKESEKGETYGYLSSYSKNKAVIRVSTNGKDWKAIKNPMLEALADEVTGEERMRAIMRQKLKDAMKSDMPNQPGGW
jgi:hypothetical protein